MNPIIPTLSQLTTEDTESQGLFEALMGRLLAATQSDDAVAELSQRAADYAESQPSYAEDLQAAIAHA